MQQTSWQYRTLEIDARQDINRLLRGYREEGYRVLHAHYAPAGNYRFLLGKREFEWYLR